MAFKYQGSVKKLQNLIIAPKGRQWHHVFHLAHVIDMIKLLTDLINVLFRGTNFCFCLAYAETDFGVHMIRNW